MKKFLVFICFMLFWHAMFTQSLLDIYKKGVVKLTPDTEYAKGNNWDKVFVSYYDTLYNTPMGDRKSIVLTPTGSVVVSHRYRNFYSLFDENGKFVKEFGVKDKSGKQVKEPEAIQGVINNTFFTGLDKMGKMNCFDLDGNYIKTLTLNYMAKEIIPLSNNKIALVGWAIWKEKERDFVAIIDFETNKEKIIWDHFTPNNDGSVIITRNDKEDVVNFRLMPQNSDAQFYPPKIAFVKDRLIVALPHSGEIMIYDINGNLKSKDKLTWAQKYLSVAEQKEIYQKSIDKFDAEDKKRMMSHGITEKVIDECFESMKENLNKISVPKLLPLFSNIIQDSDGNLLFFEMPAEEGGNKLNVWVYENGGKFVCQSRFVCDDYNLVISPSKMVFHKGYIYSLQTLKNSTGNPLRLVRFKVGN